MTDKRPMTQEEFAEWLLQPHAVADGMVPQRDQQQLAELQAALSSYRRDTMLWAERHSASQPSLADRARAEQRWAALPRWALATICLVTIAGGVAHLVTDRQAEPESGVSAALPVAQQPAATEDLAADNHLLRSIDAELSYQGDSPVDALRLQEESITEHTEAAEVID